MCLNVDTDAPIEPNVRNTNRKTRKLKEAFRIRLERTLCPCFPGFGPGSNYSLALENSCLKMKR